MRSQRFAGGLILLLLGAMFLLANMGLLDMAVWELVFRFWPVLLVAAGVVLLFGGGFRWFVAVLLLFVVVFGTLGGPLIRGWATGPLTTETYTPTDPLQLTTLEFEAAMDAPSVRVLPPTAEAYRLEIGYRSAAVPVVDFDALGTDGRLNLRQTGGPSRVYMLGGVGRRQNLAFGFQAGLRLDLRLRFGAANADLDLRQYQVDSVDFEVGAGNLQLRLGAPQGVMAVTVSTGVGNVEIWVPAAAGLRVVPDVGLGAKELSGAGLVQSGDTWQDDAYATAADKIDIRVSAGVGRVAVMRY